MPRLPPLTAFALQSSRLNARLVAVKGTWHRDGEVMNLIAGYLEDLTPLPG